jgi:uncharacterized protein (UPF0297 family)
LAELGLHKMAEVIDLVDSEEEESTGWSLFGDQDDGSPFVQKRVKLSFEKKPKFVRLNRGTLEELSQIARSKFPVLEAAKTVSYQIKRNNRKLSLQTEKDFKQLVEDEVVKIVTYDGVPSRTVPIAYWFFFDKRLTIWKEFKSSESDIIEQSRFLKRELIRLADYYAHLPKRELLRDATNRKNIIRGTWFWSTDDGSIVPYSESIAVRLEDCFQKLHRVGADREVYYVLVDKTTFISVSKSTTLQIRKKNANQMIEEGLKNYADIRNVTRGYNGKVKNVPGWKVKKYHHAPATGNQDYLSSIPFVLIVQIMSLLPLKDARSLMLVSKIFAKAFQEEIVWKSFCNEEYEFGSKQKWGNNSKWKDIFYWQRYITWDRSFTYSNMFNFTDNNQTITNLDGSLTDIVSVRGTRLLKGEDNAIEIRIKALAGKVGVGIVDNHFNFQTNTFDNSDASINYVYWSTGIVSDLFHLKANVAYNTNSYKAGDVVMIQYDRAKKVLRFLKNGSDFTSFSSLEDREYWIVACFTKAGSSLSFI